jgi:3-dehydroquinate synthase
VVKYAVIAAPALFGSLQRDMPALLGGAPDVLTPVIEACCRIKADVVSSDEREQGLRRILNFGHTIGHALEAVTQYRVLRHGEAVGYGMRAVSTIARDRGTWPPDAHAALLDLLDRMGPLPSLGGVEAGACLEAMQRDKKAIAGTLRFVLPVRIGETAVVSDVTTTEIRAGLAAVGVRT